MVNIGSALQVGNFVSRENTDETLLRLQKSHLSKAVWLDLQPHEVPLLHAFLTTYLAGIAATAPDPMVTEVHLGDNDWQRR